MQLLSIKVYNFRQFEAMDGKPQQITFAGPGQRNVTAVYGTNGAGKSGLLNAFTWALFGKTTKALKHPENLVNQSALARAEDGEVVRAFVRVEFKAPIAGRLTLHTLERSVETRAGKEVQHFGTKAPTGKATLCFATPGRGTTTIENPDEINGYINRLLPEDLYQYFFVDGERIADLAKPENSKEVGDAVEVFVGLRELTDGGKHLLEAEKFFANEARQHEKENKEFEELCKLIEGKEADLEELKTEIGSVVATIGEYETSIEQIAEKLRVTKGIEELEAKRRDLRRRRHDYADDLRGRERELFRLVMTDGWLAFALDSAVDYLESDLDLREKGQLPYKIRKPFIKELLDRLSCICGRSLDPMNAPPDRADEVAAARRALDDELLKADLSEVQQQLFGATTAASEVLPGREALLSRITSYDNQIQDLSSRLEATKSELERVEKKLEGHENLEVGGLSRKRRELEANRRSMVERNALSRDRQTRSQQELADLRQKRDRMGAKTDAGHLALQRAELCRSVATAMNEVFDLERAIVRNGLDEKIRRLFLDYSITGYLARVSEKYELTLHKQIGTREFAVSDSTGEGQALSLAFISAIARRAMERREVGSFPLVIDSQFGSLDRNYHRRIMRTLPAHVGQVILIQTKTQWSQEMREAVRERVGAEVVLTRRVTLAAGRGIEEDGVRVSADEEVHLQSGSYPYVEVGEGDSTYIRQVPLTVEV